MQMRFCDVILLLLWAPTSQSRDSHLQGVAAQGSITTSAQSATPSPAANSRSTTISSGAATCPSRTVNYITHTLPQQCLRADRAPSASSRTVYTNTQHESDGSSGSVLSDASSMGDNQETNTPSDKIAPTAQSTPDGTESAPPSSSTHTSSTDSSSSSHTPVETESDSPLDNANFLSFEDWKRQNLAKAGQSPDNVGRPQPIAAGRQHPGIYNALDTFGDENEISLDFTVFGSGPDPQPPDAGNIKSVSTVGGDTTGLDQPSPAPLESRSKDAGKTCKERTNYASFDCAANVLKSNSECKSASSVLVENKDSYMLNICAAEKKYFVVELCDDILVDTIVLANYEFFSSSFRHFRVSVSDRFPVKEEKWKVLGTYEGRNTREIQAFLVENPLIWTRYLRVEFLTHYGNEYYCPVSLLRIHGTTMIQEYLHHEETTRDEHAVDLSSQVAETVSTPLAQQLPIIHPIDAPSTLGTKDRDDSSVQPADSSTKSSTTDGPSDENAVENDPLPDVMQSKVDSPSEQLYISIPTESPTPQETLPTGRDLQDWNQTVTLDSPVSVSAGSVKSHDGSSEISGATSVTSPAANVSTKNAMSGTSTSTQQPSQTVNSTMNGMAGISADVTTNGTATESITNQSALPNRVASSTSTSKSVLPASTSSQPAQPSTQESFFKSVHKRLQQLESNSTLSLQYIEEQSRILRDAFSKVERRQVSATTTFLSTLNQTVMSGLHGLRMAYDQLWQSTVIELEGQRDQFQREIFAMSTRLTMVADELVWQKRMGIVQSTLVLMCLALVLFGRSGNGPLEFPVMQQMMMKSTAALRAGWESPPNSPSPVSRSPARIFRPKLWRSNTERSHLTDSEPSRPHSVDGPDVLVEPPTPSTPDTRSDIDEQDRDVQAAGTAKPAHPMSPPPSKKRRKRRQSLPNRNGKAKSPLAHS